jgi:hypothetical protein
MIKKTPEIMLKDHPPISTDKDIGNRINSMMEKVQANLEKLEF